MFKRTYSVVASVCIAVLLCSTMAFSASSMGGGRSFSSGGSKSFSSGGSSAFKSSGATQSKSFFTNSTPSTSTNISKPATNSFWSSKPTSNGKVVASTVVTEKKGFGGTSIFDKKQAQVIQAEKATKAKTLFVADTNKYTTYKPQVYNNKNDLPSNVKTNPIFQQTKVRATDNYSTFEKNKTSYYNQHHWQPQPYMYTHSSYDGYNGMLFWMAMNNMQNMAMMNMLYNHSDQAGYKQWLAAAEKEAETNKEVAKQLSEMKIALANMTGEKDPSKLPSDMPKDVALASDVLTVTDKDNVVFNIAVGPKDGIYCKGGNLLKEAAKDTITVEGTNTEGTISNIELFVDKKVDGFIGQKDGIDSYALSKPQLINRIKARWITLYKEPVQLIVNKDGGIADITDLSEKNVIYVGKRGSGSENTWRRFVAKNPGQYKNVKVEYLDKAEAIQMLAKFPNAAVLNVSGLQSDFLTTVEKIAQSDNLRFASIKDSKLLDINDVDGNPLYTEVKIDSGTYPNLQKGWFFSKATRTIAVDSVFVVSDEWVEKNGDEALEDLTAAVTKIQPEIYTLANGDI